MGRWGRWAAAVVWASKLLLHALSSNLCVLPWGHACGGQRSASSVIPQRPSIFYFCDWVSHWVMESAIRLAWPANRPQGPAFPASQSGKANKHPHAWLFMWVLKTELMLMLTQQMLHLLSHLSSPQWEVLLNTYLVPGTMPKS